MNHDDLLHLSQLKGFSLLTEETLELGPPTTDLDAILELGDAVATGHPGLVVYVDGPALQKWSE